MNTSNRSNTDNTENKRGESDDNKTSVKLDLTDSLRDQERLKSDRATMDLPEVKDIPGQEHIHVPPLGELADTTISSDDEEGVGVLDELDEEDIVVRKGTEADVSASERIQLEISDEFVPTKDEEKLQQAGMEYTDDEGEPLNQAGFGEERTGADLDVPGSEEDNRNEMIGEEDEENNPYSLDNDTEDKITGAS